MRKISLVVCLFIFSACAHGQDMSGHHHMTPATPADSMENQDWAKQRLAKSSRHQEWVKVKNGTREVSSFVVYPEVKTKATAVVVIHEIFGMSDWVQSLTDQLAEAGYIAIAPDLRNRFGLQRIVQASKPLSSFTAPFPPSIMNLTKPRSQRSPLQSTGSMLAMTRVLTRHCQLPLKR